MALPQTDLSATITASAVSVWIIQKLKDSKWFTLLGPNTKYMNMVASAFSAFLAATGIHYSFAGDTLTITGLSLAAILSGLWACSKSFVINELIYQGLVQVPKKTQAAVQDAATATSELTVRKIEGATQNAVADAAREASDKTAKKLMP